MSARSSTIVFALVCVALSARCGRDWDGFSIRSGGAFDGGAGSGAADAAGGKGSGASSGQAGEAGLDGGTDPPSGEVLWVVDGQFQDLFPELRVAEHPGGSVYVAGEWASSFRLGAGVSFSMTGDPEAFLTRLSASGQHEHTELFEGVGNQSIRDLAVGSAGVLVTGHFDNAIDFPGFSLIAPDASAPAYVARLDANNAHVWSHVYTGAPNPQTLGLDGAGNVRVAFTTVGPFDFGTGVVTPSGGSAIAIGMLDPGASPPFVRLIESSSFADLKSFRVSPAGDQLVAGAYDGTIDFGGGRSVTSATTTDVFVALLESDGSARWARSFGSTSQQVAGVDFAPGGDALVVMSGAVDFGQGEVGDPAGFAAAALDGADGMPLWSFGCQNSTPQIAVSDGQGGLLISGDVAGTLFCDGGVSSSGTGGPFFLVRLSSDRQIAWDVRFDGAPGGVGLTDIAMSTDGDVLIAGGFDMGLNIDGTQYVTPPGMPGPLLGAFVARIKG